MPGEINPATQLRPLQPSLTATATAVVTDVEHAKDALIAWFRGEFAAANAIIDALCGHLSELSSGGEGEGEGGGLEYEAVFTAVHRRRMNWIPVLQMQKYHSVGDVAVELKRVMDSKKKTVESSVNEENKPGDQVNKKINENIVEEEGSLKSDITDSGYQEVQPALDNIDVKLCTDHQDCNSRPSQIKLTKGFTAKEHVKGHMVNVVRGLKLYEEVFTESELSKLTNFVKELRVAGQNGDLSGQSFILFNKEVKGNRREMIQFGVPLYDQIKEEASCNSQSALEPIPMLLQGVIDHLVQWNLLPEQRKPNSCIINFFEDGEYSQPFVKPPHLEQPISILVLSESTMAFGRMLASDSDGNYKAPISLPLRTGSLLVMRGHCADMAGHVMCSSPNKRISISFFKVRHDSIQSPLPASPSATSGTTIWQPGMLISYGMQNGTLNGYEATDIIPKLGVRTPLVMLAPVGPMVLSPRKISGGGTGVFFPWNIGCRKPVKHLPPRCQKGRTFELPSHSETHLLESSSEREIEMKSV